MNNWILYSLLKNKDVDIDSVVAAAIAKVVGNADASFDTLEEIAAWIEQHPESIAAINKEIQNIKTQLENIELTPGPAGHTPEIGDNGNWIIAGVDTGVTALGTVISSTRIDEQGHLIISFTDGSELDAGDATGEQGPQGIQGKPFTIAKTYSSIEEMNNDFENEEIDNGAFVIIVSETNDEDNAKLYIKGETSYTYVVDLSGMQGIQGEQGPQGKQGNKGSTGKSAYQYAVDGGFDGTEDDFARLTYRALNQYHLACSGTIQPNTTIFGTTGLGFDGGLGDKYDKVIALIFTTANYTKDTLKMQVGIQTNRDLSAVKVYESSQSTSSKNGPIAIEIEISKNYMNYYTIQQRVHHFAAGSDIETTAIQPLIQEAINMKVDGTLITAPIERFGIAFTDAPASLENATIAIYGIKY